MSHGRSGSTPSDLRTLRVEAAHERHADLLDPTVEGLAVRGLVVEPKHPLVLVVAEVVEAGVAGDLRAELEHPVEDVVDAVGVGEPALGL